MNATEFATESNIIQRALALRKARRIGVLWAEGGWYWISEDDRQGARLAQFVVKNYRLCRKPIERRIVFAAR